MPAVNPEILVWARETAGLSVDDAAQKLQFHDTSKRTAVERLLAYESGQEEPSRSVLKRMADKYRRSLLVFYLEEPPPRADRGEDFRTLPGDGIHDANLDALIRKLYTRQSLVKSLLEDEEAEPLPFIGSHTMHSGVQVVANDIVSTLSFDLQEFRSSRSFDKAFTYLRSCVERSGIFVLLVGDLGSSHSKIPVEVFRGFVISDPIAPFVVVNDNDSHSAWSFTLLHEVAHLWLGTTGISGGTPDQRIERFCNEVAADILLPVRELAELADIRGADFEISVEIISTYSKEWRISRGMIAYNLLANRYIDEVKYQELIARFTADRLEEEERKKRAKTDDDGGPNYYSVRRHRLGAALIDLAQRALSEGALSPTKAGILLDMKPSNVNQLLRGNAG